MRSTKKTPSTKHVYIKHKKAGNDLADIQKRSCMACGSQVISEFGEHLHRCENCGLVVAKEIPTFDELIERLWNITFGKGSSTSVHIFTKMLR
jgi:DNA-directed RNA polymerase subunit N (RpoN/RPB10)